MKRPVRRARRRRPAPIAKRSPRSIGRIVGLGLAASGAVLAAFALLLWAGPGPGSRSGTATDIVVPAGARLPQIARILARSHAIWSATAFMVGAKISGAATHLQAGEYEFPSGAPLWRVIGAIRSGAVVRRFVTVPEGVTSAMVAQILQRASVLTGPAPLPPEGAVLPETYQIRRGEPRSAVLGRMTAARDRTLQELWSDRAPNLPYRTAEEAVVLASIVEKETAKSEERPHIAGLFINRLRAGMRLESDPTVIYGLTGGAPLGHGLRVSELASRTPYNTYLVAGLPPTPIANPGVASLAAALQPAPTEDLYFVADGTGGHVFSSTLAEHLRNVARWRSIERAKAGAPLQ